MHRHLIFAFVPLAVFVSGCDRTSLEAEPLEQQDATASPLSISHSSNRAAGAAYSSAGDVYQIQHIVSSSTKPAKHNIGGTE